MWKNDKRHGEGIMTFKGYNSAKLRFNNGKVEAVLSYEYEKDSEWAREDF